MRKRRNASNNDADLSTKTNRRMHPSRCMCLDAAEASHVFGCVRSMSRASISCIGGWSGVLRVVRCMRACASGCMHRMHGFVLDASQACELAARLRRHGAILVVSAGSVPPAGSPDACLLRALLLTCPCPSPSPPWPGRTTPSGRARAPATRTGTRPPPRSWHQALPR